MTQTNIFDGFTINLFQDGDWLAHLRQIGISHVMYANHQNLV
jgi:hypothetical protein